MAYKILLIDDSLTQLEILRRQLVQSGFEVETAKDGNEGYTSVFKTAPDLILSDIVMPNFNGYQLCRLLKNNDVTKQIPIILLTVLDKKIDKFWGNKSGANKFISKGNDYQKIEESVKKIIAENPVSGEYKKALISSSVSGDTIQNQINMVLDELLMSSTFLNEFRDLGEYLSHDKVLVEKIFDLIGSFVDYNVAGLFLNDPDKNGKSILYMDLNKKAVSGFVIEKIKRDFFAHIPDFSEFSVIDFGHEILRESIESDELIIEFQEFKTQHIVPIVSEGKLFGGLCFYNTEVSDYSEFKFYKTMISELLLLLKMRYLYSETEYLSVVDGLTGLYNRRHFEGNLEREFLRVRRYIAELSIAMIDIDNFKKVNDTYGHQCGDYILKEISKMVSQSFRKTDMIYRYGGEEIVVILTETALEGAMIPLERLREKISNYEFLFNEQKIHVTISLGVASYNKDLKSQKELVEGADKALYRAKQTGRNRLVAFSHEEFNNVLQ